jgi:hypothetical protein
MIRIQKFLPSAILYFIKFNFILFLSSYTIITGFIKKKSLTSQVQ